MMEGPCEKTSQVEFYHLSKTSMVDITPVAAWWRVSIGKSQQHQLKLLADLTTGKFIQLSSQRSARRIFPSSIQRTSLGVGLKMIITIERKLSKIMLRNKMSILPSLSRCCMRGRYQRVPIFDGIL